MKRIHKVAAAAAVAALATALATVGAAAPAYADTSQPLCTNTTYNDGTNSQTKKKNYGSDVDWNMAGATKFALVECVVSGLPAGATVTSATLDSWSRSGNGAHTLRLHNQPTAWIESTVTWNSLHTYDAAVISSAPGDLDPGNGEWVSLAAPVTGNGTYRWALDVSTTTNQAYGSDDYLTDKTHRPVLIVNWSPAAPAAPVASFTANPTSGQAPLTVQFTDTSTGGPTSWAWDFGDGATSTSQSPSHTYAAAGTYTATLTASNAGGSTTASQTITVSAVPPPPAWTTLASYNFDDGVFPAAFYQYNTRLASGVCTRPGHAAVTGGVLQLKLSYEASGTGIDGCGAEWYSGTVASRSAYGGDDVAIEFDMRLVPSGVTNVGSHQNWAMGWPATDSQLWYQFERDFCEGRYTDHCFTYLHYQQDPCCVNNGFPYSFDMTQWHRMRIENMSTTHHVRVLLDGVPVVDYQGDATTVRTGPENWVLQQECASDTSSYVCPSGTTGQELQQYDNLVLQRLA